MNTRAITLLATIGLVATAPSLAQVETDPATTDSPSVVDAPAAEPAAAEVMAEASPAETDANPAAAAAEALNTIPVEVAQDEAPAAAPEPTSSSRLLGEIVVTAQKREENLQDVPISVAAFSAEQLDAKGIDDPKALAINTPGMVYNQLAGYSIIYMRGIGSDAFIPSADGSIATYIDGIYYPFNHGLAQSFGAVERIEVLKGPQGTLFGRNSTGGAISVVTKKPDFSGVSTDVQVSYASYDQLYTRVHTNLPLTDNFAVSLSGLYNREDPYYDLVFSPTRQKHEPDISRGFRGKARWAPIDALDITYSHTFTHPQGSSPNRLVGQDIKPAAIAIDPTTRVQPDYVDGSEHNVFFTGRTRVDALDTTLALPWLDMRLLLADQDIVTDSSADYDGTNGNIASFRAQNQISQVKTAELQFISNSDSWGADWLRWIGGVYYIESTAGYDPLYFGVEANVLARTAPLPDAVSDLLRGVLDGAGLAGMGIPGIDDAAELFLEGVLDTESTAFFAQATADLTDWMALTLGGRYQTETREITKSSTGIKDPFSDGELLRLINFPLRSEDTNNFSPKVTLDFKPWDASMIYLGYSKGFKSGTFNIINIYQANSAYIPPETVESYELGFKGDLLDGYMRFNAAVFFNEITDVQVQTISLTSGGAVRFETAGGAEIKGAEFDIVWEALPNALPGLVLVGNAMYLDGEYTDYSNGTGFDDLTGVFVQGQDFTGNETLRTPEYTGSVGVNYSTPFGPGTLELGTDMYFNSGFFFTAQNKDRVAEESYEILNARISYLFHPWNVRVTAYGKNMNDGKYHNQMFENDFSTWKTLAPPSYYGVRLNWEF